MTTISTSAPNQAHRTAPNANGIDYLYSRVYNYAGNVYFQDGKLLTGILVSLLYLTLAVSLDAAGYVESMALLIPVTLGALALGLLMAFSRFDGFFALSHSMFTGLAWILFLMARSVDESEIEPILSNGIPEFQAQAYLVLIKWVNWIEAALSNQASADNYVFIFEIAFLLWWLTYLGVWAIFRHGYTWRAIIPAGVVLLINAYYAPQSIVGFLVIFSLLALVLLVRTHLAEQQLRWRERRIHFNPDIGIDFLRNGFMFSVIVIALAWLSPSLGRNFVVRQVMNPLNQTWLEANQTLNDMYAGLNRRTAPSGSAFGNKLSLGGARNVTDRTVFHVDADTGRYWRAVTYDHFNGREWSSTTDETRQFNAGSFVPVANWALREPLTQTITLQAPTGNVIFGAPDIYRANVPMTVQYNETPAPDSYSGSPVDDTTANVAFDMVMAHADRALEVGDSYTVISRQTNVTQRALTGASNSYPALITERYLQLPDDFSSRVAQEAERVVAAAAAETVYDQVKAIETFLRSYEYNEEIAAPPRDQDPIEYFLYDIQEGYCDYYATSMVLMLRHLGIPARAASGYAEGTYDDEIDLYVIAEKDAHTWVEVYFPGFGWIEFEPTAGESELTRPEGDDSLEPGAIPGAPNEFQGAENPEQLDPFLEEEMMNPGVGELGDFNPNNPGGLASSWSWWSGLALVLAVVLIGGFFLWRSRILGPTHFTPDMPPILFDRMQRWAARLGIHWGDNRTPYEQAHQLGRALPDGRLSINRITDSYVHYQFSPNGQIEGEDISSRASVATLRTQAELPRSWRHLHSLFWKAWMRKFFNRFIRRKSDPFSLVE